MALIKFGDNVVVQSGKVGGNVYSRNRGGAYRKNWVKPNNPQTTYQTAVRTIFTGFSQGWRLLTSAQRTAWNSMVENFQRVNRLGDLRTLSGKALYQSLNNNLLNVGAAAITSPLMPAGVENAGDVTIAAAVGANTVTLTFVNAIPADMNLVVEATPGLSPGITNASNRFRQVAVLDNGDASPYALRPEYDVKYGAVPAQGSRLSVRVYMVNNTTGEKGTYTTATCIVAA